MIFINAEGADGSGKTTVIREIENRFNQLKDQSTRKLITTNEPKGIFRDIILDANNKYQLTEIARLFLYQADRSIHINDVIKPNLKTDNIIISDRGPLSTLVYQSLTTKLSVEKLYELTEIANEGIWPDLFIIFDCNYEVAKKRMDGREKDYFDNKGKDFYDDLAKSYKIIGGELRNLGFNVIIIDATKPLNIVIDEVFEIILGHIN